nr:MAG TPA: hypothetical protein [Caudoviricetes sp.]DAL33937.1 MAG TPA_asm: hypothetical protein [Caudoviricetes sp.]DAL74618.1 MAG TPA: hypothetical protein [Caudoviricetes sp.]
MSRIFEHINALRVLYYYYILISYKSILYLMKFFKFL